MSNGNKYGELLTTGGYPPPPIVGSHHFRKKYHGLLYLLYQHLDYGPLTVKEWWDLIGADLTEMVGIDKWVNMRRVMSGMSTHQRQFVYSFDTYQYGPKKYIISTNGISKLRSLGLITNEDAASAKQRLLGVLDGCMDEGRLSRILKKTKF